MLTFLRYTSITTQQRIKDGSQITADGFSLREIDIGCLEKPSHSHRGFRDCVETRFAALPPDVRKGCALPARPDGIWGYAPSRGRSPGMIRVAASGGAEPPPHIGRHSRDAEFPHRL